MKTPRNLWPYGLIAAFVLFFSGITTAIVIAVTHRDSLVSENYYEQELKFQGQQEARVRARTAGASLRYDAAAARVVVAVPVAQLDQGFVGRASFYRADASGLDRDLELHPGADGAQELSVAQLVPGPWTLRVNWQAGGHAYFLEDKLVVPAH